MHIAGVLLELARLAGHILAVALPARIQNALNGYINGRLAKNEFIVRTA